MASNVLQTLDRLDVLVNNVGGFWMTVSSGAQAMGRKWILRMRRTRWRPRSWRRTPRATGSCCLR